MNNKKEKAFLEAAIDVFSQFGYHAVGVDLIVERSGAAKMTLYKYFSSKDILIERALMYQSSMLRNDIMDCASKSRSPMGRLKSIFDWYERRVLDPDFSGDMFIKASEEFSELDNPIKIAVQEHKDWMVSYLIEVLNDLSVSNSRKIAQYIVVVLDGFLVNSNVYSIKERNNMRFSWQCIKQLVESHQKNIAA